MRKKEWTDEELYNRLSSYCARAERCRSDVLGETYRLGVSGNRVTAVLDRLEREGFVDARRYARAFVHDRMLLNGWGRNKVRTALHAKRIAPDIITAALQEMDAKDADYEARLRSLLEAKRRTITGDARTVWGRLMRFGVGRGYEYDSVARALAEVGLDGEDDA